MTLTGTNNEQLATANQLLLYAYHRLHQPPHPEDHHLSNGEQILRQAGIRPDRKTYKFRTGEGINGLEDIRRLVDEEFLEAVMEEMGRMRSIQRHALERSLPDGQEDEFEEII